MEPVIDRAATISCPILGLFGVEDKNPSPEEVAQIDAELTRLGKEHEFHTLRERRSRRSSPSTGPRTASRPPSRAGGSSSTSTAGTC